MGWLNSLSPFGRQGSEDNVKSSLASPSGGASTVTDNSSQRQPAKVRGTASEPASNEEASVSVKAPQTFNEALAALRGELAVIPNYERVMSTVSVALAGGYMFGWREAAAAAAKYPAHQRHVVRRMAARNKGVKFGAFALIYEGSVACLEALRQKKDLVNGAAGGALAGTAFGISGGLSSAGRGMLVGSWLGAVVEAFQLHLKQVAEENLRLAQLHKLEEETREAKREEARKNALKNAIESLEDRLESWPDTQVKGAADSPESTPGESDTRKRERRWWSLW